jgi:hypothetical protein
MAKRNYKPKLPVPHKKAWYYGCEGGPLNRKYLRLDDPSAMLKDEIYVPSAIPLEIDFPDGKYVYQEPTNSYLWRSA